jgi:hypothetical protein
MVVMVTVLGGIGIFTYPKFAQWYHVREAEKLLLHPLPLVSDPKIPNPNPHPALEVNLPVPFTPQAPHGNWELPYQEACEEASALMAIRYAFGNPILSPGDADAGILDLVRTNAEILRNPIDQTAAQVRDLILEIDQRLTVRLIDNPSVDDLQQELASGNVIIVPAKGRELKNPFFRQPGPLYHMLVLRGYTSDGYFITNDPGTKRGEEYLYPFSRIMTAMHDWPIPEAFDFPIDPGGKVVLVVEPLEVIDPPSPKASEDK